LAHLIPRAVATDSDQRLAHLHRFASWLDEGIRLPGTQVRIGLDPVIGLMPGFGDAAGAVLSAAILVEAVRRGVSRFTLGRIAWNIVLDALLGAVPVIGDAFDFVWKANLKNVALIERHVGRPNKAHQADRLFVVLLIGSLFLLCAALMVAGILLTAWLFRVIAGHR
jgi:hypothetical protein